MAGQQRRDEREQGVEVCRKVDVRVGEDRCVAGRPGCAQRSTPALLIQVHRPDALELCLESLSDPPRRVGARVVGNRDPGRQRKSGVEVAPEAANACRQLLLFVEDRDDDIHDRTVAPDPLHRPREHV